MGRLGIRPCSIMYIDIHTHRTTFDEAVTSIVNNSATASLASAGIHPWDITQQWEQEFERIRIATGRSEVVAIGECGIDKIKSPANSELQKKVLEAHIGLSEEIEKPLILHCVRGADEIIALHKKFRPRQAWIIHGFRGKPHLAKQLLREGFFLSFGEKFNSDSLIATPLDRLFAESDTSDKGIKEIYASIARIKNISPEELAKTIRKNAGFCGFLIPSL